MGDDGGLDLFGCAVAVVSKYLVYCRESRSLELDYHVVAPFRDWSFPSGVEPDTGQGDCVKEHPVDNLLGVVAHLI